MLQKMIKKGDFKQERMFGRAAKIPTANTSNELTEINFADYGDFATFLHIRATSPRFSEIVFTGPKKNKHRIWCEETRFQIVRQRLGRLKSWRQTKIPYYRRSFHEFCTARSVILHTAIPGHHQSLGATGRRRGFSDDY